MSLSPTNSSRFLAFSIDVLVALGLSQLLLGFGWLLGIAYWLLRDSLFNGQSIGKRVLGLRVVTQPSRERCGIRESLLRNILWVVPLVCVVMAVSTLYYLVRGRPARHWGDRLAQTEVIPA